MTWFSGGFSSIVFQSFNCRYIYIYISAIAFVSRHICFKRNLAQVITLAAEWIGTYGIHRWRIFRSSYICVCVCVCVYIYIHTHTHIYIANYLLETKFSRHLCLEQSSSSKRKRRHISTSNLALETGIFILGKFLLCPTFYVCLVSLFT